MMDTNTPAAECVVHYNETPSTNRERGITGHIGGICLTLTGPHWLRVGLSCVTYSTHYPNRKWVLLYCFLSFSLVSMET